MTFNNQLKSILGKSFDEKEMEILFKQKVMNLKKKSKKNLNKKEMKE